MKSTLRHRFALASVVIGLHCMLTHRALAQDANSQLAASADPLAGAFAQRPEKPNVVELARGWRIDEWNLRGWHHPSFPRKMPVAPNDKKALELVTKRDINLIDRQYTMADALFSASFLNACLRHSLRPKLPLDGS